MTRQQAVGLSEIFSSFRSATCDRADPSDRSFCVTAEEPLDMHKTSSGLASELALSLV